MTSSRSPSVPVDEELRLPRTPGAISRFWSRHPRLADVLIVILCILLSVAPNNAIRVMQDENGDFITIPEPSVPVIVVVTATGLLASLALLGRRRWPIAVFVIAAATACVNLVLLQSSAGLVMIVAAYSLAVYRSTRAAWIGFGISVGAYALMAAALWFMGGIDLQTAVATLSGHTVLILIGTLLGANVGGRKRYVEAIIDRSRQLLVERDQHAQLAAAAERDRIAREMHDIVSHSLTVVVALSEGAAATPDPARAQAASTAAAATARSALAEMRSMLGVLREGEADAPLAPLEPVSPAATVDAAQRAGYAATLTTRGAADGPPALRFAIGRIVQEGVTNAMRHAPNATAIDVRIDHATDPIIIEIVNDGVRGPATEGGFGLRGLSERATLLGGRVVSAPAGAGRWMLRAELPAAPAVDGDQA